MTAADQRADRISARVTGIGVGLITFMVTWLISARMMERIFTTPTGAFAAMALAVTAGVIVSVVMARRFVQQVRLAPPGNGSTLSKCDERRQPQPRATQTPSRTPS